MVSVILGRLRKTVLFTHFLILLKRIGKQVDLHLKHIYI